METTGSPLKTDQQILGRKGCGDVRVRWLPLMIVLVLVVGGFCLVKTVDAHHNRQKKPASSSAKQISLAEFWRMEQFVGKVLFMDVFSSNYLSLTIEERDSSEDRTVYLISEHANNESLAAITNLSEGRTYFFPKPASGGQYCPSTNIWPDLVPAIAVLHTSLSIDFVSLVRFQRMKPFHGKILKVEQNSIEIGKQEPMDSRTIIIEGVDNATYSLATNLVMGQTYILPQSLLK